MKKSSVVACVLLLTLPIGLCGQQPMSGAKPRGSSAGPSDSAKSVIDQRAAQLGSANKLKEVKAKKADPIISVSQAAARVASGPVDYAKAWKEITEYRAKLAGSGLTRKEAAILKALESELKINFAETPLREVIAVLSEKTGQAISVPDAILEEAGVDYSTPVTLKLAKPATMRSILSKVLRENGLSYVVKDETILVVAPELAEKMMMIRTYPIGELIRDPRTQTKRREYAEQLIRIIQNMIEPPLWDINGGAAAVLYSDALECLVVRAPGEVHLRLGAVGFVHRTK